MVSPAGYFKCFKFELGAAGGGGGGAEHHVGASGRPVRGTGGTQVAERSQDGKGRKIEEEIFFANKSTSDGLEGSQIKSRPLPCPPHVSV